MSEGLPGLTQRERELVKRLFSSPIDLPTEFTSWLSSWVAQNVQRIPVSTVFGAVPPERLGGFPNDAAQTLLGDGTWGTPTNDLGGKELDYKQSTSDVSTTNPTVTSIITSNSITVDGSTAIVIEFGCAYLNATGGAAIVNLFEDTTDLGIIAEQSGAGTRGSGRANAVRRTPAAGSHTYTVKLSSGSGTVTAIAGTALWIRITQVA